ncbi:MAG: HAMP domain-containing histidine kinase [Fibrobacteres bacterium]|nr:HAMP domain-containing histidine kinase [Fibrobacterota bacterium]
MLFTTNMNRLTLRIAITLYLMLGLFVGGVGYYLKNHLERETSNLLTANMNSIANVICEDISGVYIDYLLTAKRGGDYSLEISQRLRNFSAHFKLKKVTVCDTAFVILASTDSIHSAGKPFFPLFAINGRLEKIRKGETVATPIYNNGNNPFMSVYIPVKGDDGRFKAILSVESSAEFFVLLHRFERFFIFTGIIFAVFLIFGAWFISRQLSQPIRDMAIVAKKIGDGDVGATVTLPLFRDEIRSLAVSINTMSAQLKIEHIKNLERVESLRILAAGVAHEVRNPVQGISLYADRLRRLSDPNINETAEKIKTEIRQIERIVNDLLDYTKDLTLVKSTFNTYALIQEVLAANGVLAKITGHCKTNTYGDRARLKQVFSNVIKNAIEASFDLSTGIAIQIKNSGNFSEVEIHNNGKEIDHETMSRIFQPFFTTKAKGTGLGLALCKKIVEAHEGTITIKKSDRKNYTTCVHIRWNNGEGMNNG